MPSNIQHATGVEHYLFFVTLLCAPNSHKLEDTAK